MGTTGVATTHTVTITDSDKTVGTLNLDSADYTIASTALSTHRLVTRKYDGGTAAINVAAGTTPSRRRSLQEAIRTLASPPA